MGKGERGTEPTALHDDSIQLQPGTSSVLEDPRFAPFRDSQNFSVAEFTSSVLAGSHTTVQVHAEQLKEGLRIVDTELTAEVKGRKTDLLKNVRRMLDAERALGDVVLSVESLQSAIRRIRAEITGPYDHIRTQTVQLRNLHATVELLRHLIHRLKLTQKLQAQMAAAPGSLDLAKAAKLITDIRAVGREADLSGIEVVANDEDFLTTARQTVQDQAEAMLLEGMESMSQAKVGSALQVYFNLEELSQAVESLMSSHLSRLEKLAKSALDARQLTAGAAGTGASPATNLLGMPVASHSASIGPAGSWQEKLWSGLKALAEGIAASATAIWHLQRVVAKKKDPLTHVCFLDELVPADKPLLTEQFWTSITRMLGEVFSSVAKPGTKTGSVRDTLVGSYPKLAAIFETMFERLTTETSMKGVLPAVGPEQLQQLLNTTAPIQAVYLAASLNRMSDAVASAFPGGSRALTSPADIQKCIRLVALPGSVPEKRTSAATQACMPLVLLLVHSVVHEELKSGSHTPQMAALSARTAGKALELLAEKAVFMAATGPEVRSVSPGVPATPSQLRNIALCSQLQEVHRSLVTMTTRLPPAAAAVLTSSLDMLQATAVECVAPIFKSVVESLEERLMKIHSANFASDSIEGAGITSTSSFITEATTLITHFRSEFLSKFVPPPSPTVASCVSTLVERMASRLLIFFCRHCSLVRPLSQSGRLQMAKDLAELQLAVGASLFPLEQLGPPHRVVKAFRALLFAEPSAALTSSNMTQDLPPSLIAHHLFTRLDASIQAPHERSGLSPAQYSRWLDTHSTEEVLRGVQGALEAAVPAGSSPADMPEAAQIILHICKQVCS